MNDRPIVGWKRFIAGSNPRKTVVRAAVLGVATFLLLRFVCLPLRVQGVSMEPTFRSGQIHCANLLKYAFRSPRRGDIAVVAMTGNRAFYMKRVLGLPGERIAFAQGRLLINGRPEEEPWIANRGNWMMPEMTIPEGEYFVAGDNRALPIEWHTLGTVKRAKIRGGLFF